MRRFLLLALLCSCGFAQQPDSNLGPDFSRATRARGSFYLNGLGHQYLRGKKFTVVATAIPVLNGKFFGVKVRVLNRSTESVNVLPEMITAEDSVGARTLDPISAAEVADRVQRPNAASRLAGIVGGPASPQLPGNGTGVPTMADLLRELTKESSGNGVMGFAEADYPTLKARGSTRASAHDSPSCDLGCELRNREIADPIAVQLPKRLAQPELIEQGELLSNTVPPDGDIEGIVYFAMPKLTDRAPISHNGKKSYLVTVTVPVGDEKFQFVFPPE